MGRKIIVNLAVGTKFLRMALGCMRSTHRICKDRYAYVIFHAWCDTSQYEIPRFVRLINIESLITSRATRSLYDERYRVISMDEIRSDGFAAREIKGIPFVYPEFIDDDMVFLDADVIVYEDRFEALFERARTHSVATIGETLEPSAALYRWPHADWTFNLREQARMAGFDIANRHVHTGIVCRGGDHVAKYIAATFDYLLQTKPLPLFPAKVRYFNDEAYFAFALSLAAARFPERNFHTLNDLNVMKTTLKKTFLGIDRASRKPILGDPGKPDLRDTAYAILHFHTITTWDSDFYHAWLDRTVPAKTSSRRTKAEPTPGG